MLIESSVTRLAVAAVLLLTGTFAAQAQQVARMYRVGLVSSSPGPASAPFSGALRQGLRELGYVEGNNVIVEERFTQGRPERVPDVIAELIGLKVDVLVVGATVSALEAKKATTTVPIVFAYLVDPVATGIVSSLARPGGNITGVTAWIGGMGFAGKWMELLKEVVPDVSHVAVLSNSANPACAPVVREIEAAAQTLKVKLDVLDAANATNPDKLFAAIGASGAHGVIAACDPFFILNRAQLVQFAASKRLPAMYFSKLFVDAGGLMSYGPNQLDSFRRAATYVDKILKGANPADLPIEQPTRFDLVINMKTAKALGLTIPQRVLLRAEVID